MQVTGISLCPTRNKRISSKSILVISNIDCYRNICDRLNSHRERCIAGGLFQSTCFQYDYQHLFIQYIKSENFQQFGYKFIQHLNPRHWYQFADDATVVTGLESENQVLLNAFNRWCTWAHMIIRVDKCHAFGMKKVNTLSKQFQPKLYINNEKIPPVKKDESFKGEGNKNMKILTKVLYLINI